jgi:hypothetical protein
VPVLLIGTVLAARPLWLAFGEHRMSITDALTRLLFCLAVAAIMVRLLRGVTGSFGTGRRRDAARRKASSEDPER